MKFKKINLNLISKLICLKLHALPMVLLFVFLVIYNQISQRDRAIDELTEQLSLAKAVMADETLDETKIRIIPVSITSYNLTKNQCDSNPLENAEGKLPIPWECAISPDLKEKYCINFGDSIVILGLGRFRVGDLTNARFKNRVDVLSPSRDWSERWGNRKMKIAVLSRCN